MARKYGRSTRKGQRRKTARRAYTGLARRPRRRGASPRVAKLESALKRARSRSSRLSREHKNPKAPQALGMGAYGGAVVVAGGGAAAGVVSGVMPDVFGIDSRLLAGAALVAWGAMQRSEASQIGACLGSGMLACVAQDLASGIVAGEGVDAFTGVIGLDTATGTGE